MHAGFQTGLPALLSVVTKCQRTLNESIRNIVFSSVGLHSQPHLASAKSVQTECRTWKLVFESYAEVQPDFAKQRYNMHNPKSKFFGPLISHLEIFPHPKMGIQPFIYGHSGAFPTRKKKWNRDMTFYLMPILKMYEATTFFLTQMLQSTHLSATVLEWPHLAHLLQCIYWVIKTLSWRFTQNI